MPSSKAIGTTDQTSILLYSDEGNRSIHKAPPEKLGMPVAMSPGVLQQTSCVRGSGSDCKDMSYLGSSRRLCTKFGWFQSGAAHSDLVLEP